MSTLFAILRSTLFAFVSSLIKVYTVCHSQQSDQGLHCMPYSAVWPESTLFVILISLMRVYTVCHAQQSEQVVHYLLSSVSSGCTICTILSSQHYFEILSKHYYQGLHCLQFWAVWSESTLLIILSSLIKVYTICDSQQSYQGLHCLPFWAV